MRDKLIVTVGIPSTDHSWVPQFGMSFGSMIAYFGGHRVKNCVSQRLALASTDGSMLANQRDNLVLKALKNNSEYLLMIDTDMDFPRDVLNRLLEHDLDVVAANCVIKRIPSTPTAEALGGGLVYTDENSTGLQEVKSVGAAVMLFRVSIFQQIPRPWFYQEWVPEIQHPKGEDRYFCDKARKYGFKIFIDHDVSKQIKHIGQFAYDHSVVGEIVKEEIEDAESEAA